MTGGTGRRMRRRIQLGLAGAALAAAVAAGHAGSDVTIEKTAFRGWTNCYRVSNGTVEFIATTDVGPRIISFGFVGVSVAIGERVSAETVAFEVLAAAVPTVGWRGLLNHVKANGLKFDEKVESSEKLRGWLEGLRPEDFGKYKM